VKVSEVGFAIIRTTFADELTERIADFLRGIGIRVTPADLGDGTFLPGIRVHDGGLLVDASRLRYPGDLLHEAGHLAVLPRSARRAFGDPTASTADMREIETQAIAWSYASALEVGVDPALVFHAGGYRGRSAGLLMNFALGVYLGVDGLQAAGMAVRPRDAERLGVPPYPHMVKWVRD
jgi:hypothetical protein